MTASTGRSGCPSAETVLRSRTDWVVRYRVPTKFPIGNVVPYLQVYFNGDTLAGWALIEVHSTDP